MSNYSFLSTKGHFQEIIKRGHFILSKHTSLIYLYVYIYIIWFSFPLFLFLKHNPQLLFQQPSINNNDNISKKNIITHDIYSSKVFQLLYIFSKFSIINLQNSCNKIMDIIRDLSSKNAAVIFMKSSCCMCHSIKALFYSLGASPAIHELDQEPRGAEMEWALKRLGCSPTVPAVFIGGEFVGSAKDVISLHVDGSLKQRLISAKAIWF